MSIHHDKCMCNMIWGESSVAERDCVSGDVWEGFIKESLINGAVKGKQVFSGGVGGTFQIDI